MIGGSFPRARALWPYALGECLRIAGALSLAYLCGGRDFADFIVYLNGRWNGKGDRIPLGIDEAGTLAERAAAAGIVLA